MALDNNDRNWLDGKFTEVHNRITKSDTKNSQALNEQTQQLTVKIGHVQTALSVHEATPCVDVVKHEDKSHNPVKFWGVLASIVVVAAAIGALIMWLIRSGTTRP